MTVTQQDIERGLRDLGLDGAHVLAHTSYKSFGGVDGGPKAVVDALVKTVATLMMPSFTSERTGIWDARAAFEGNAYPMTLPDDWTGTPEPFTLDTAANVTMGVINETFRRESAVSRSNNPMLSFVAHGELADELTGPGAEVDGLVPIKRLMEAGGQVLLMGVTHTNSTAVHLAEQLAGREMFVRYGQTHDGPREARGGGCGNRFDDLQPHIEHLERRVRIGGSTLHCYALQPYVEIARQLIADDPFALLCPPSRNCVRCDAHRNKVPV